MKTKETFLTIDPPSGWKYGFPKAVTQEQYKEIKNLKQWCIDQGYPKSEADSYGDYFHIQINGDLSFMNDFKSTREQALEWWNSLFGSGNQIEMYSKYYPLLLKNGNERLLTNEEIEEIWLKEIQHVSEERTVEQHSYKPNQKQFKEFNESLFRAYINKFSDEDKLKALKVLLKTIPDNLLFKDNSIPLSKRY